MLMRNRLTGLTTILFSLIAYYFANGITIWAISALAGLAYGDESFGFRFAKDYGNKDEIQLLYPLKGIESFLESLMES